MKIAITDLYHDAAEWLIDHKCQSCNTDLICQLQCDNCNVVITSLRQLLVEIRQNTLEELLPPLQAELKAVQGGGYEGEIAIETCIDIVKQKLQECTSA